MSKKYSWNKYSIIVIAPAIIIGACFLALAGLMKKEDISNEPTTICDTKLPGNVWLISYADGTDVHFKNQRYLVHSAINKCINSYISYSSKDIDPSYKKAHNAILAQDRGVGYWLWKPYFILKTLETIPENDIVLYVDSGVTIIKPVDTLVNYLTNNEIVLFEGHESWTNKLFVKRELLKVMGVDNEETRNSRQLQASYILLKNSAFSRDFIKKWLNICENERAITDIPSQDEYPEFVDHRHDQSILTLLYMQRPDKIYKMPDQARHEFFGDTIEEKRSKIHHYQ